MNIIKGILLLFCMLFFHSLEAQPKHWRAATQIEMDKKANVYARRAKKEAKNGKMIKGLMYAAKCLNTSPKKKNINTAVGVLTSHYQDFIAATASSIAGYQEKSKVITKDSEVNARYEVVRLYAELDQLQQLLKKVPTANFRPKKDPAFNFTPKDYSNDLVEAKTLFEAAKVTILKIHYDKAMVAYNKAETVQGYRFAARLFNLVMNYDQNYEKVAELYPIAKEKGTTRLVMHAIEIPGMGMALDLTAATTEHAVSSNFFDKSKDKYPYFDFQPADPTGTYIIQDLKTFNRERNNFSLFKEKEIDFHYRIIGEYVAYNIDEQAVTSETVALNKEITIREEKYKDADGKDQKRKIKGNVKGTITNYFKKATVRMIVNAKIQSTTNNTIIEQKDFEVNHLYEYMWSTYTGDKRALESYHRDRIDRKPQTRVDKKIAVKEASNKLGINISEGLLLPFAKKYGGS